MNTGIDTSIASDSDIVLKALRQELKQWEASFFSTHNRKAGRIDIKQHLEIEEKYKRYNDLRHPAVKKPHPKPATSPKKRLYNASSQFLEGTATPTKRSRSDLNLHPSTIDAYDPPVSMRCTPVTHRTVIGPTPQKDGVVLGLFDTLSSGSSTKASSKRTHAVATKEQVQATPTKHSTLPASESEWVSTGKRHHKSPLSASVHFILNSYQTPSACRVIKNKNTPCSRGNVSKLRLDETPNFLRRDSQRISSNKENLSLEDSLSWSPVALRKLPTNFAGKGLSTLVKGLRDMEEQMLDEDLDVLREMEEGHRNVTPFNQPRVLVEDSQKPDMPLGPDGGCKSDNEQSLSAAAKDRDGKPLRAWKKKGQKRTTRKVVIKPSVAKWKPEPAWKARALSEEEDEERCIRDTQLETNQPGLEDTKVGTEVLNNSFRNEGGNAAVNKLRANEKGKKVGFGVKVKKRISATAHANFRVLKIKNKQSKGKRSRSFKGKR